jgi:hypothetical protein
MRLEVEGLAMALGSFLAAALAVALAAVPAYSAPQSPVAVAGIGLGATWVDLPDANVGAADLGATTLLRFDLGYAPRPWLELGGELGLGFAGESDSLNALLTADGITGVATRTHIQALAVVRTRWPRAGARLAPFARAGAGAAGLSFAAPGGRSERDLDPAWTVGGGIDLRAHRRILVRAEAAYVGQAAAGRAAHHAAACISFLAGVPAADLDHPEAP